MTTAAQTTDFREDTKPLLRPGQVQEMQSELARLEGNRTAPPHIRAAIQDPGSNIRQMKRLKKQLETQAPQPYGRDQIDAAVSRSRELEAQIVPGMPTQAEMRKAPPGAADKLRAWERRHKREIQEWKNIQLRRHAGGDIDGALPDASDVANLERLRPAGGSAEMNMDNALIPGKQFHMPPGGIADSVVLDDAEIAYLREHFPDRADEVLFMSADQRRDVKAQLSALMEMDRQADESRGRPETEWDRMRKHARSLGIDWTGMNKDQLTAAIADAEATREANQEG